MSIFKKIFKGRGKGKFMKITTRLGNIIKVDISDESCLMFGFKHGNRIINPNGHKATIMGVAPINRRNETNHKVLWYVQDVDDGKASCWSENPNKVFLPDQGFEKLEAAPKT